MLPKLSIIQLLSMALWFKTGLGKICNHGELAYGDYQTFPIKEDGLYGDDGKVRSAILSEECEILSTSDAADFCDNAWQGGSKVACGVAGTYSIETPSGTYGECYYVTNPKADTCEVQDQSKLAMFSVWNCCKPLRKHGLLGKVSESAENRVLDDVYQRRDGKGQSASRSIDT